MTQTTSSRGETHLPALRAALEYHHARSPSPQAIAHARLLLLDTLGCALAGRTVEEVRGFEALLAARDHGAIRLPGGVPLSVGAAAQVLAMAATWYEACEGHAAAHGRPGVPVVAALVPLALQRDATLEQILHGLVFGYEIGARAGAWLRILPGMHVDGNWPALGVAAAVAKLLSLDLQRTAWAVNIAGCQLPTSLYLPVKAGRTARNTYLGHSATLGIDAAYAAAAGIDAPQDALAWYAEHHSTGSTQAASEPTRELILDAYLKPLAAVRHVHYGAYAACAVREALSAATDSISSIELAVYQEAITYCGNRAPRTAIQAQFSLTFGIAAMLRFGELSPASYAPDRLLDPELRRLEALIELHADNALTERAERGATLRVRAGGVDVERHVGVIPGDGALPLTRAETVAKFVSYAEAAGVPALRGQGFADLLLDTDARTPLRLVWSRLHD